MRHFHLGENTTMDSTSKKPRKPVWSMSPEQEKARQKQIRGLTERDKKLLDPAERYRAMKRGEKNRKARLRAEAIKVLLTGEIGRIEDVRVIEARDIVPMSIAGLSKGKFTPLS